MELLLMVEEVVELNVRFDLVWLFMDVVVA